MDELLPHRTIEPMFQSREGLGREEGTATPDATARRLGFGWKRWSRQKLYDRLGLFSEYRVVYLPKALPV